MEETFFLIFSVCRYLTVSLEHKGYKILRTLLSVIESSIRRILLQLISFELSFQRHRREKHLISNTKATPRLNHRW